MELHPWLWWTYGMYIWCLYLGRMLKKSQRIQSHTNEQKNGKYAWKWETPGAQSISLMKKRLKDNLLVYKCLLSKGMKIDNWWLFNLADKGLTRFNSLKFKLDKLRSRNKKHFLFPFFFFFFPLYREDNQLKIAIDAPSLKTYKSELCQQSHKRCLKASHMCWTPRKLWGMAWVMLHRPLACKGPFNL